MTRETLLIVLVAVCLVVILTVLAWAVLRGASLSVDRAVKAPVTFDDDARFSPDTEAGIMQALAVADPRVGYGTVRREGGA